MMKNKKGFTLLELLVVVMIVGILAAVALPKYQKAIERARVTKALVWLKALAEAQEAHYITNGSYATTWDVFSIDLPKDFVPGGSYYTYETTANRTDGKWVAHFSTEPQIKGAISIGHPQGQTYQGAGFIYFPKHGNRIIGNGEIACQELISYGPQFKKSPHDFCVKIANAVWDPAKSPGTAVRTYFFK